MWRILFMIMFCLQNVYAYWVRSLIRMGLVIVLSNDIKTCKTISFLSNLNVNVWNNSYLRWTRLILWIGYSRKTNTPCLFINRLLKYHTITIKDLRKNKVFWLKATCRRKYLWIFKMYVNKHYKFKNFTSLICTGYRSVYKVLEEDCPEGAFEIGCGLHTEICKKMLDYISHWNSKNW